MRPRRIVNQSEDEEDSLGDWDEMVSSSESEVDEKQVTVAVPKRKPGRKQQPAPEPTAPTAATPVPKDDTLFRSPILCVMGHVDTGKTKLLDKIRKTSVGEKEAGGITQQIGATFFPRENLLAQCAKVDKKLALVVPGLLIIDTPGHASFSNLRKRGSSLCDIAILVVDIMHGVEPQTKESMQLLKQRRCPFIVALNKIDRLNTWASNEWAPLSETVKKQKKAAKEHFKDRARQCLNQLIEGAAMNFSLYNEVDDPRKTVSVVPISAQTGEGIPDLLCTIVKLTQTLMQKKITLDRANVECSILEVKTVDGMGAAIDVILVGGILKEGDMIVVCGMNEPIVTTIRCLLTPHAMRESRVKGQYERHSQVCAALGVRISAPNLENAVAGTTLKVVSDPSDEDEIERHKEEVQKDISAVFTSIDKTRDGVYVVASTLGSLEALLQFLEESEIPVNGVNIGTVHKLDVMKAATMNERGHSEYAVILAFDVKIDPEAEKAAKENNVTIYTADVIYHLFDQFTKHMDVFHQEQLRLKSKEAIYPCMLRIMPQFVFNTKAPLVFGVRVEEGVLKVGTPLIVPDKDVKIGTVESIELNKKPVDQAKAGQEVCIKVVGDPNITIGRHFEVKHRIVSHISRASINVMKEYFRADLQEHAKLVQHLKKVLGIV